MSRRDHKRTVNPREHLAPALVRADVEGSIWIVVGDIVGKNEAHVHRQGGGRAASKATDRYREAVRLGLVAMTLRHETGEVAALTHPGPWHLDVLGVWPRRRSKEAMATPRRTCSRAALAHMSCGTGVWPLNAQPANSRPSQPCAGTRPTR